MNSVDTRFNLPDLGLDRLGNGIAADDQANLHTDPLLAELGRPAVTAPVVDDGETVLATAAWEEPTDQPRLLEAHQALRTELAGLDRADAIDRGVDAMVLELL